MEENHIGMSKICAMSKGILFYYSDWLNEPFLFLQSISMVLISLPDASEYIFSWPVHLYIHKASPAFGQYQITSLARIVTELV